MSTDKQELTGEVEAMVANADQILASVQHAQKIKDTATAILADLNPVYKEKQETEKRFGKIEGSISDMKDMMQKQQKMMEEFIKKFN